MPRYRYHALSAAGESLRGEAEAESPARAAAALQRRGLLVLRVAPAGQGVAWLAAGPGGQPRLRRGELADVTRELATLLGAGQDIDHALRFMLESANSQRAAAVLGRVRAAVRDGTALATALRAEPRSFPRLYTGLVAAGEAGGDLAAALGRLADLLDRQRSLTATVQSALAYPAILVLAATGSVVLLLTQVLPQFVPLFAENGAALPASTAFLLGLGNWLAAWGLALLAGLAAAGFGLQRLLRRPGLRLQADRALLRMPVAGGLWRDILTARFTRALGALLAGGVPLLAALAVAEEVTGNLAARAAVRAAAETAKSGHGIARSLAGSGVFAPSATQLLKLGEDTAQLGAMALRAAEIHEERTRLGLQRLVALLVPVITIVMGAVVAGIVSSLLLAMLNLNDAAQ